MPPMFRDTPSRNAPAIPFIAQPSILPVAQSSILSPVEGCGQSSTPPPLHIAGTKWNPLRST